MREPDSAIVHHHHHHQQQQQQQQPHCLLPTGHSTFSLLLARSQENSVAISIGSDLLLVHHLEARDLSIHSHPNGTDRYSRSRLTRLAAAYFTQIRYLTLSKGHTVKDANKLNWVTSRANKSTSSWTPKTTLNISRRLMPTTIVSPHSAFWLETW